MNIPIPTPSTIHQVFVSSDSLVILGAPAAYDKHSFVWLDEDRLLLGGFTSLNRMVHGYVSGNRGVAVFPNSKESIVFNLSKGIYESLPDHPQLHEMAFPIPIGQASSKIAYISNVSGYVSVWLYDMVSRKARPLTKRLSNSPIIIHGLQWNDRYKILSFYYSADSVVNAYTIPL